MSGHPRPARAAVARVLCLLAAAWGTACRQAPGTVHEVPGGDADRGRQLVVSYGCGACHQVPGVRGAVGRVGPSFAGFGDRAFVAGELPNQPAQVIRWIRAPQAIRPGTVMPDLAVTEADAGDIAAYLYTLRSGGLGPPHLLPVRLLPGH